MLRPSIEAAWQVFSLNPVPRAKSRVDELPMWMSLLEK